MKHTTKLACGFGLALMWGAVALSSINVTHWAWVTINLVNQSGFEHRARLKDLYLWENGEYTWISVNDQNLDVLNGLIVEGSEPSTNKTTVLSSVWWWDKNKVVWEKSGIWWWYGNTVNGNDSVIGWWFNNSIDGDRWAIAWWSGNSVSLGWVVLWWEYNRVNGDSVVLWGFWNEINGDGSLVMWNNAKWWSSSFVWNDGSSMQQVPDSSAYIGASSWVRWEIRMQNGCFYAYDGNNWHSLGKNSSSRCQALQLASTCRFGWITLQEWDKVFAYAAPYSTNCEVLKDEVYCRWWQLVTNWNSTVHQYPYCYNIEDTPYNIGGNYVHIDRWNEDVTHSCFGDLPDHAVLNNKDIPIIDMEYSYSTDTSKVCTYKCIWEGVQYKWNSSTRKCDQVATNVCHGSLPSNAYLNTSSLPSNNSTNYYYASWSSSACSYSCFSWYVYSWNECVIWNWCVWSVPGGAILLPWSDSGLTWYVNIKLYADYSSAQWHKCAYYCGDWYYFVANYIGGSACLHNHVEYQCLWNVPEHAKRNTYQTPYTGNVNYFYASWSSAPCSYTCNSWYVFTWTSVSAWSCITWDVIDNTQPDNNTTTYKCTGSVPNTATKNNDKVPTNGDIAYYYSTNTSDPCTYRCPSNTTWNGSSCKTQTTYACVWTYPTWNYVVVSNVLPTGTGVEYYYNASGTGWACSFTCQDRGSEWCSFYYADFHKTWSWDWAWGCSYRCSSDYHNCIWPDNVDSDNTIINNYYTPSENMNYYYSANTSDLCTFSCESWYVYTWTALSWACVWSWN